MKPFVVTIIGLLLLPLAMPAHALHCNGEILAIGTGGGILYVDDRSDETGEINHWTYLESNGIDGLQSGGDYVILEDGWVPVISDPCDHDDPDRLII